MDLLKSVKRGRETRPRRVLLYGAHGIGKSTWPSTAPKPIYLQTEDGLADIGVDRTPLLKSTVEVSQWLIELSRDASHGYQTLVIDTLDWLEKLIWQALCQQEQKESIEDFGYGKGYGKALSSWEKLLKVLDQCREVGKMNIVLLSHARVEKFAPPEGEPYDRWSPDLHKSAAALVQEWVDEVLFATVQVYTTKDDDGAGKKKRTRAVGSGDRLVRTVCTPYYAAKRRIELPDEIPLYWEAYQEHWPTGNGSAGNVQGVVVEGSSKTKGK
jgi:hypothetical protein